MARATIFCGSTRLSESDSKNEPNRLTYERTKSKIWADVPTRRSQAIRISTRRNRQHRGDYPAYQEVDRGAHECVSRNHLRQGSHRYSHSIALRTISLVHTGDIGHERSSDASPG